MINKKNLRQQYRNFVPQSIRVGFFNIRQNFRLRILSAFYNLIDKNVRNKSDHLQQFQGKYKGQRCFIMGNGPSLNQMDLGLLQNEYVWGSNRCYLLFDKISWRPKFYMAVDTRVVPDNAGEINKLYEQLPESHFFFPIEFRYQRILKSAKNVYWYMEIPHNENDLPNGMFSRNPSAFVYSVRTVTIAMIQMAVYLGFNPIYLIGCDTSYKVPETIKHEDDNKDFLISTDFDLNHLIQIILGRIKNGMNRMWIR